MKSGVSEWLDFVQLVQFCSVSATQTLAAHWKAGYTNSLSANFSSQQSLISVTWVKTVLETAE